MNNRNATTAIILRVPEMARMLTNSNKSLATLTFTRVRSLLLGHCDLLLLLLTCSRSTEALLKRVLCCACARQSL